MIQSIAIFYASLLVINTDITIEKLDNEQMASLTGVKTIAVLGCGAIGLTTAIQAQRKGMKVTIYAKERPPYVRLSLIHI